MTAVVVMAKAPRPGLVKTRLCPPLSGGQAAELAEACLTATLEAVAASAATRRIVVLDGPRGPWLRPGLEVLEPRGRNLAERLASAFEDVGSPALAVGMDTPQLTPALLDRSLEALGRDGVDAVLGPAEDGGYWAIGLASPDRRVFEGVVMSRPDTAAQQLARLDVLGLHVADLPGLRDVDTVDDARAVAAAMAPSRFTETVMRLLS